MMVSKQSHCPSPEDVHLLQVWRDLQTALCGLTDVLLADAGCDIGLTGTSFQALWFLYFTPGRSAPMSALARELRFSTAGVTKLTDRLADSGLIRRMPDANDRRVTLAQLTDDGEAAVTKAAIVLAQSVQTRIVDEIGLPHFEQIARTLSELSPVKQACPAAPPTDADAIRRS
jgi:DNA-binding MarR family transcriptional regulator